MQRLQDSLTAVNENSLLLGVCKRGSYSTELCKQSKDLENLFDYVKLYVKVSGNEVKINVFFKKGKENY